MGKPCEKQRKTMGNPWKTHGNRCKRGLRAQKKMQTLVQASRILKWTWFDSCSWNLWPFYDVKKHAREAQEGWLSGWNMSWFGTYVCIYNNIYIYIYTYLIFVVFLYVVSSNISKMEPQNSHVNRCSWLFSRQNSFIINPTISPWSEHIIPGLYHEDYIPLYPIDRD